MPSRTHAEAGREVDERDGCIEDAREGRSEPGLGELLMLVPSSSRPGMAASNASVAFAHPQGVYRCDRGDVCPGHKPSGD